MSIKLLRDRGTYRVMLKQGGRSVAEYFKTLDEAFRHVRSIMLFS